MSDVELIRSRLTLHPDFPKKGIVFLDILPIFRDPLLFETLITHLLYHLTSITLPRVPTRKIDVVVGLDARGFLFGPVVAMRLNAAFAPVRKVGKLPGECVSATYQKEYGSDVFELQVDAIKPGQTVVIVDDLIATGGSAKAAGQLVTKLGGTIVEYIFIVEIPFLKGTNQLDAPVYSVMQMDN